MPLDAEYSASKAYNERFSNSLHFELKEDNIDVLALRPLYVSTAMTGRIKVGQYGAIAPEDCA